MIGLPNRCYACLLTFYLVLSAIPLFSQVEGVVYVDGKAYARTGEGVRAALRSLGKHPGKLVLTPGVYSGMKTIRISGRQTVEIQNAELNFDLAGSEPAFTIDSSDPGAASDGALVGSGLFNLHHTGGVVFELCAATNFTLAGNTFRVLQQTGDTVQVGPCTKDYSTDNVRISGISADVVPGNFISVITNNYAGPQCKSPFIMNLTVDNTRSNEIRGRALLVKANAAGPEVNVNGLLFRNNSWQLANSSKMSPIYIESSFISRNSINLKLMGGYIVMSTSNPSSLVDVDRPMTAFSLQSVVIDSVNWEGGMPGSKAFSQGLLDHAPDDADLEYVGQNNPGIYRRWQMNSPNLANPTIGGGSTIGLVLNATVPLTFGGIGARSCIQADVALKGARMGMAVMASPEGDLEAKDVSWSAWAPSTGIIKVRLCNAADGTAHPKAVNWHIAAVD